MKYPKVPKILQSVPHNNLSGMSAEQLKASVIWYSKLPIAELRKRQSLVVAQQKIAYANKNTSALKNLGVIEDVLTQAVMKKTFKKNPARTKTEKINMFGTNNDTDKYVVAVDGYFGVFDNKKDAEKAYNMIGGYEGSDGLAETPFGSAQFMPPKFTMKYRQGFEPREGMDLISKHKPINIVTYIKKKYERSKRPLDARITTAKQRLDQKRFMKEFFGE